MPPPRPAVPNTLETGSWVGVLEDVIDQSAIHAVYQPIVDVARGRVVGYESLARFDDPSITDIDGLFVAAQAYGVADQLEAAALRAAFRHRSTLPGTCFLTVNVSPAQLASVPVQGAFDEQGSLDGVIIELTEQTAIDSYAELEPHLERYRHAGALLAVDDAGTGYAGLRHVLDLRPSIIKLDRHFIDGVDLNPTKRVLIEMLGTFANRTDCWLLAEGIERAEELDVIARLGVPLAQGYLLGRPGPPWVALPEQIGDQLSSRPSGNRDERTLRALVEPCQTAASVEEAARLLGLNDQLEVVVVIDGSLRPSRLADIGAARLGGAADATVVALDTTAKHAARRAMGRPPAERFKPLVAVDETGRYAGIVRVERLVEHLSAA